MCSLCYATGMASLSDRIREQVVRTVIAPARARGARRVQVKVGEVERAMGLRQRAPTVCRALQKRAFLRAQGLRVARVAGPPSGLSPRVVLTYALEKAVAAKPDRSWFDAAEGMMRGMWDEDGGGEAWLRKERSEFYGPNRPYGKLDDLGPAATTTDRHEANRGGGLRSLRGLLRGVFDEDGGGEAWLRKQREPFNVPGQEP